MRFISRGIKEGCLPLLERAKATPRALAPAELAALLAIDDDEELAALFAAAYDVKVRKVGRSVSFRGLAEIGNVCAKDCLYCGIRKSNAHVGRYQMPADEIVACAEFAAREDYGSLVIQSGEIESESHTRFIEDVLRRIRPLNLGVTLSLGEQEESVFQRWREAGASRYLLRIETSNRALYSRIHPQGHSWERRRNCLAALRRCGYQVGTGVMSGLPGQSFPDLANDIAFFGEIDADMIGMGPFIPHAETPLNDAPPSETLLLKPGADAKAVAAARLRLGLKMIAVARLYLHDVNIAAATALQALADDGREQGLRAGANVIMPNITDTRYRRSYQLYDGKPCLDENATACRGCLQLRIASIGETIAFGRRGDSPHWHARTGTPLEQGAKEPGPGRG